MTPRKGESREAFLARQRERARLFRAANPELVKIWARDWYRRNADRRLAKNKTYRDARPGLMRARAQAYYEAHREEIKAKSNARYEANRSACNARSLAYNRAHPDQRHAINRRWYERNLEDRREYSRVHARWVRQCRGLPEEWMPFGQAVIDLQAKIFQVRGRLR